MWGNSETIVRMIYGENLSIGTMDVWLPSLEIGRSNDYKLKCFYTQASGSGLPLTGKAEGEEIVCSSIEI